MRAYACVLVLLLLTGATDLESDIAALDRGMFDAYNRCDMDAFGDYLAANVEFYRDQSGELRGRREVRALLDNAGCGLTQRKLVDGSLAVYPIRGYGALETGINEFYRKGDPTQTPIDQSRFVMLWQLDDRGWSLTRAFSYDHHTP